MSARHTQAKELSTQVIDDLANGCAAESLAFGRFDTQPPLPKQVNIQPPLPKQANIQPPLPKQANTQPPLPKQVNESLNTQAIRNFTESFVCDESSLQSLPTLPLPALQQLKSLPTLPGALEKSGVTAAISAESTRESEDLPSEVTDPYLSSLPQLPGAGDLVKRRANELTTQV
jgi:hypothetical protein